MLLQFPTTSGSSNVHAELEQELHRLRSLLQIVQMSAELVLYTPGADPRPHAERICRTINEVCDSIETMESAIKGSKSEPGTSKPS
jgi:hypothetical protein